MGCSVLPNLIPFCSAFVALFKESFQMLLVCLQLHLGAVDEINDSLILPERETLFVEGRRDLVKLLRHQRVLVLLVLHLQVY